MDLNRNVVQSMWLTEKQMELAIYLQPLSAMVGHGGPWPGFIAPWVYKYVTHELQDVLKELRPVLSPRSLYCDTYREVRGIFISHS